MKFADSEKMRLDQIGSVPIKKRRGPGRSPNAEMQSNLSRVLERRGYQRFYYHVATTTVAHWWDHQDILNNVQMEMEQLYGAIVELVAVRELRGDRQQHVFHFYFKIGPIPTPLESLTPVKEQTFACQISDTSAGGTRQELP